MESEVTYSWLEDLEQVVFERIHTMVCGSRKEDFAIQYIGRGENGYYSSKEFKAPNEYITQIIKKALRILEFRGVTTEDIDEKTFHLEFQQRNCSETYDEQYSWIDWHRDDYTAIPHRVYTVLFYVRVDRGVKGGELQHTIGASDPVHVRRDSIIKYQPVTGDVLTFPGDLLHYPTPTWGFGCRDVIAFFIKRKSKN